MPTASGTHSAGSARSAPGRATARPIAPRPEAAVSIAPLESTLTTTEQEPTTIPGSRTTRAATSHTVPAPSPEVQSYEPTPNPQFSGVAFAGPVQSILAPQGEVSDRWVILVDHLSAEIGVLRSQVAVLQDEADKAREDAKGLRSSLVDLEGIVMRELVKDSPLEEPPKIMKKTKKSTIKKGDVLSRQNRSARKSSHRGATQGDDSSSSSDEEEEVVVTSSSEALGAEVTGLVEQITRRPEFKSLVSYRTYRLKDVSQGVDSTVTGRVNTLLKRLKHHVDYKFTGEPAIQVVDFLRIFKEACDLNNISEGAAAIILPYFLEGRAKHGLASRMKTVPTNIPKFPAAVQWLLQSFATEGVIAEACQRVFSAKQLPEEDEKTFANRLEGYATTAGSVFTEDVLIASFVDGLHPYAGKTVRSHLTPTMTFAELRVLAEDLGAAGRSLTNPGRSRWLMPTTSGGRTKPLVAASLDSSPYGGESTRTNTIPGERLVAAVAEDHWDPDGYPPRTGSDSPLSNASSISVPTRGWVSTGGSLLEEAAIVAGGRNMSCHLCLNSSHLLMECPLLGIEARQAAQRQRELKFRDYPNARLSHPRSAGVPNRYPGATSPTTGNNANGVAPPRYGTYRSPGTSSRYQGPPPQETQLPSQVAVHPVEVADFLESPVAQCGLKQEPAENE
jgi:hypothetical protein